MKKPPRKDLSFRERLSVAVVGIFVGIYGYGQILRGKLIYTNSKGQDVPALFVIFLGALFLITAVFPWGRIHFLWDEGKKKRHP
jgi:H+/Cl- antiporter ClcA